MRTLTARFFYVIYLLLFAEVALQLFYYWNADQTLWFRVNLPIYARNPITGYWNKPFLDIPHNTNEFSTHLYTNSKGFRVSSAIEEYMPSRDPSAYRIMLLGPSFAFGWGVNYEDSFAAHLQSNLNTARYGSGQPVQVINTGVPSHGSDQQIAFYKADGYRYAPDLVVLISYGTLDIFTDYGSGEYEADDKGYLVNRSATWQIRLRSYAKRSALVFYSWQVYTKLGIKSGRGGGTTKIEGAGRNLELHEAFSPDNREASGSLQMYKDLKEMVEATGGHLVVLHFPLSYVIHAEDIARWQHLEIHDIEGQVRYEAAFCAFLNASGIQCENVTQDLKAVAANKRLYYWADVHWTPAGNRVAAATLAKRLVAAQPDHQPKE